MAYVLSSDITNYQLARRKLIERPGFFEQLMVVVTVSTLLAGLPVDWFTTRTESLAADGNLKMVAAQLALMLFAVMRIIGRLDEVIQAIKLEVTIFVFCGLAMASLFWSADMGETIRQSIVLTAVAFYGLYLFMRFDLAQILRLFAITFLINGICSLVFVFVYPTYGLAPTSGGEWIGVYTQKNALGFAAAIAAPVLIVAARSTPRLRFVFYGGALLQMALLFFSESKTMYVAGFGTIVLLGIFRFFRGKRTLRGAVIVSLVGSSIFAIAFATANIALLARWLDKDVSLTGRVPLWEDLIPIVMERFVLGHGYRAVFGGYFSPVHEVWILHPWQPPHAHNAVFHLWLEVGLVGVVLFFISFFRAVKRSVHGVNLVHGAVGLWPLAFLSTSLLVSISESGVNATDIGWLLYVCAVLSAAFWNKMEPMILLPEEPESQSLIGDDPYDSAGLDLVGSNVR